MREAEFTRQTNETKVFVKLNLDGVGNYNIKTPINFLNHMLEIFAFHSLIDLTIDAKWNNNSKNEHHLVEDIGITLGETLKKAVGDKKKLVRYGASFIPMDKVLSSTVIDIVARPNLVFNVKLVKKKVEDFDTELLLEFFEALSVHSGFTIHINTYYGENTHHIIESIFKSFAYSIKQAVLIDEKLKNVLSTKGTLL